MGWSGSCFLKILAPEIGDLCRLACSLHLPGVGQLQWASDVGDLDVSILHAISCKGVALSYVLDTDVVVAAMRGDHGASRQLLLAALNRRYELLLSVPLILEYEAVLTRPEHLAACQLSSAEVGQVLDDLAAVARPVRLAYRWRLRLTDPDDDMVLETAINGGASAIVTFNQRDFVAGIKAFDCTVISPATALREMRSSNL